MNENMEESSNYMIYVLKVKLASLIVLKSKVLIFLYIIASCLEIVENVEIHSQNNNERNKLILE